jgi:predicted acetyltransferase
MLFYEASVEIVSEYRLNGIGSAIDVINNIWSTSFTASDYTQIASLIENLPENSFAKEFQESDVLGYLDTYVNGIDYLTWTSPAFPITQANDEITTDNVLTGNITEIT